MEGVGDEPGGQPALGHVETVSGAAWREVPVDLLPDGIVVADEQGSVVCFSESAGRLTGLRESDVLGKHVYDVLPFQDAEGRPWWSCTDPYRGLNTRTRQPERYLILPTGRRLSVTARYVRGPAPTRSLRWLAIVLRDDVAAARAERSSADLVSTVAHELRSPLTSVKGFTATLLAKWDRFTDEQRRLMLETVNADADRVTRLITELLDISRIESGRLEVKQQLVDVPGSCRRAVEGLVAAGTPGDAFSVTADDGLAETWGDPDKLDQILGNLLDNALRHGAGLVTVHVGREGDGTAVTVTDGGPGIPDEVAARVFTKFWRYGHRGGTGLGLYIVKGLVEAHGGTITLGRGPSGGASFRFVLPAGTPEFAS